MVLVGLGLNPAGVSLFRMHAQQSPLTRNMGLAKALHNIFDISQSVPASVPSCQLSSKKSTTLWRVSNSRTDGVGGMGGSPL